jgi:hypothetical protein
MKVKSSILAVLMLVMIFFTSSTQMAQAATCESVGTADWNQSSTWINCGGGTPSSGDTVTIKNGHTVTIPSSAGTQTVANLTVESGGRLKLVDGVKSNGTFAVEGTLEMAGGAVDSNSTAPTYGSSSTLNYSSGSTFNRADEWKSGSSGAGVPLNVQISNNTTLNVGSGRTAQGSMTIDSGSTLQAPSTELTVKGDFHNNGTFQHNNGRVRFSGGTTQEINGDSTFYNLSISESITSINFNNTTTTIANQFSKTAGPAVDLGTGTFIFTGTSGSITGSSAKTFYNFKINSAASLSHDGGSLTIKNNFTNNGTFTQDATLTTKFNNSGNHTLSGSGTSTFGKFTVEGAIEVDAGSHDFSITGDFAVTNSSGSFTGNASTVTLNGSDVQTIKGSGTKTFNHLVINNANGVTLESDTTVNGTLNLASGRVTLASSSLTLGTGADIEDGSGGTSFGTTKMMVAEGTGAAETCDSQLIKAFTDGTSVARSFSFPIGDDSSTLEYSPATINFTTGDFYSASLSLCVTDAEHPNNQTLSPRLSRYWTVAQSGISNFSANVTFEYLAADVTGDEGQLYGVKYDGGTWTILNQADAANDEFTGSVSSLSDFTAGNSSLPVTLSSFHATTSGNSTHFEWQTATEVGHIGFNLYVESEAKDRLSSEGSAASEEGLLLINEQLIPSFADSGAAIDSLTPQDYRYDAKAMLGERFYLEEVDILGQTRRHGPFLLDQEYGHFVEIEPIDWASIRSEHEAKAEAQQTAHAKAGQASVERMRDRTKTASSGPLMHFHVDEEGLYRVTHTDLVVAGVDLSGTMASDIALLASGRPVPITIGGENGEKSFGDGSYIEFYGEALDTLYTKENVYTLLLDPAQASRVQVDETPPSGTPATFYSETVSVDNNRAYSFSSPTGDPWYDLSFFARTSPVTTSLTLDVVDYVDGAAPASLSVTVWGFGDWPPYTPDHHLIVQVNEVLVAEEEFDGIITVQLSAELPAGTLQEGQNTLKLILPGDTGAPWDVVAVDRYTITYPRAFWAQDGRLAFNSLADSFQVMGLTSPNLIVYRLTADGLSRLTNITVNTNGDLYEATFAGSIATDRYLVTTEETLLSPLLIPAPPLTDITSGTAQYLMIAHPDFIASLTPLVNFHQQNGFDVRVVNVEDIYDQFSGAIFDPQAIKDYLVHAHAQMGTEYLLLVGGDTYDYHDYLAQGSISFIPSFYLPIDEIVAFAPADPLIADVDGDQVPDLKLGRLPVRTSAELTVIIAKTLAYATKSYPNTAIFAADEGYSGFTDALADYLPPEWKIEEAYLDELDVASARSLLIDQMNQGVAVTGFFGHSGPTTWTFDGLFNADDAVALTNQGKPTVVAQFGCWNSYHVTPSYNTLAHKFMLAGEQGAAAVLGATTLTQASSDKLLGDLVMARMVQPGTTIGEALQAAKAQLAANHPNLLDVQLGYTILGDPALSVPNSNPLALELALFEAIAEEQQIRIRWETVSEFENLGFNLYRSQEAEVPGVLLNDELIPSQAPGSGQGFSYQWQASRDDVLNETYYWLADVDVHGVETLHGPVRAIFDAPTVVTVTQSGLEVRATSRGQLLFFRGWELLVMVVLLAILRTVLSFLGSTSC